MVPVFNRTRIMRPQEAEKGNGLADNRGVVLVIVLIMLLMFSILGATVLTNSTSELKVSANFRNQQQAFFTADGALEQGHISNAIYSIIPSVGDSWTGVISYSTAGAVTVTQNVAVAAGAVNAAQVVAENISSGPPPRGSGYDDTFVANNYDLEITGYGPNNTAVNINSGIARIQVKNTGY